MFSALAKYKEAIEGGISRYGVRPHKTFRSRPQRGLAPERVPHDSIFFFIFTLFTPLLVSSDDKYGATLAGLAQPERLAVWCHPIARRLVVCTTNTACIGVQPILRFVITLSLGRLGSNKGFSFLGSVFERLLPPLELGIGPLCLRL